MIFSYYEALKAQKLKSSSIWLLHTYTYLGMHCNKVYRLCCLEAPHLPCRHWWDLALWSPGLPRRAGPASPTAQSCPYCPYVVGLDRQRGKVWLWSFQSDQYAEYPVLGYKPHLWFIFISCSCMKHNLLCTLYLIHTSKDKRAVDLWILWKNQKIRVST